MKLVLFVRCFVVGVAVFLGSTASSQTSILGSTEVYKRISGYDPKNPKHEAIAGAARILCGNKYTERIEAGRAAAKSLDQVSQLMKEGADEAGLCAHRFSYDLSVIDMSPITGMSASVNAVMRSSLYEAAREESANANTAMCKRIRYRIVGEVMADPMRLEKEMPMTLLEARLFCMSLLGKQSGVAAAMNYYFQLLN